MQFREEQGTAGYRLATESDIPDILQLYAEGRAAISRFGIDQWQNGYPAEADIRADISASRLWKGCIVCADGAEKIAAVLAVLLEREPMYDNIYRGAWKTGASLSYVTIHRFAVSETCRGMGWGGKNLQFGETIAKKMGRRSVRVDTHPGNLAMRSLLEKHAYACCGEIYLTETQNASALRVAYEKVLC